MVDGLPEAQEVMKVDLKLGLLSSLLDSSINALKKNGVNSLHQQIVYNVESNGLLLRPHTIELELIHGRLLSYYDPKEDFSEKEAENAHLLGDYDLLSRAKDLKESSRKIIKTCDHAINETVAYFREKTASRGTSRGYIYIYLSIYIIHMYIYRERKCKH
jgi:hypothetical protein